MIECFKASCTSASALKAPGHVCRACHSRSHKHSCSSPPFHVHHHHQPSSEASISVIHVKVKMQFRRSAFYHQHQPPLSVTRLRAAMHFVALHHEQNIHIKHLPEGCPARLTSNMPGVPALQFLFGGKQQGGATRGLRKGSGAGKGT